MIKHVKLKDIAVSLLLVLLGAGLVAAALGWIGYIGRAHASTGQEAVADPIALIQQIVDFARTGHGTMAVGAGLTLVVWILRSGLLKKVSWFSTTLGGWTLGLSTAVIAYVSASLLAGQGVTVGLIVNALLAGLAAAGGWEAVKDVASSGSSTKKIASVSLLLCVMLVATLPGCGGSVKTDAKEVVTDVVDCTKGDLAALEGLVPSILPLLTGDKPDWKTIEAQLETAGARVASCVLANLIQRHADSTKRGVSFEASQAMVVLKARLGVRVVKTRSGEM